MKKITSILLLAFSSNLLFAQELKDQDEMFTPLEIMATYPHGNDSLRNLIYTNLKWPDPMFCGEGIVVIKVVIDDCGLPMDYEIEKGIAEVVDKEALRVVKLIKKWNPSIRRGVAITSDFYIPVKFRLD